jgi:molybdopterin synthase sulfur carrier subunit
MGITVSIPTAFRRHTEGLDRYDCPATNLKELLDAMETRFPELKPHLRDEDGKVRRFLNIYVNDEDIRFLGANYKFSEGDEVTLVPSIAGG